MAQEKVITRQKLVVYARVLGHGSTADRALDALDLARKDGKKPAILMTNNGFRIRNDKEVQSFE